jgi:hypothetical protein
MLPQDQLHWFSFIIMYRHIVNYLKIITTLIKLYLVYTTQAFGICYSSKLGFGGSQWDGLPY